MNGEGLRREKSGEYSVARTEECSTWEQLLVNCFFCLYMAEGCREFPSVVDRYFTRWYKADVKGKHCEDYCILQHSNRICVITLAECHPVLQSGKTISSISYQISANCSRLQNKVSGKSKRGAQFLTELAPLCRITCTNSEEYTVYSCIRGRLLEVNENILHNPELLKDKPTSEGYIAVVLPKFEESKTVTEGLLSQEQYEELLLKRTSLPTHDFSEV